MIDRYLQTRYTDGGRGPDTFDCWGLVRHARHTMFGKSLLPSYDNIHPSDKPSLTAACAEVRGTAFREVTAAPGAIAAAWIGKLCMHVGLVVEADGMLWVLETNKKTGPVITRLRRFESRYTKVIYHDD